MRKKHFGGMLEQLKHSAEADMRRAEQEHEDARQRADLLKEALSVAKDVYRRRVQAIDALATDNGLEAKGAPKSVAGSSKRRVFVSDADLISLLPATVSELTEATGMSRSRVSVRMVTLLKLEKVRSEAIPGAGTGRGATVRRYLRLGN